MRNVYVKEILQGMWALNCYLSRSECFDNSVALYGTMRGSRFVSGWLVNKYDAHNKVTAIIRHWWVQDVNGKFFDSTPNMTNDYQYVQDMDIFWYGQNNLNEIENRVAMSLMFKENTY